MVAKSNRRILNISLHTELHNEVERLAGEQAEAKGELVLKADNHPDGLMPYSIDFLKPP